jgi:hypothetical protein
MMRLALDRRERFETMGNSGRQIGPPNVPAFSCGRQSEPQASDKPVCQLSEVGKAGMPRSESKPSDVEGHPHEEAYLSEDFGQGSGC